YWGYNEESFSRIGRCAETGGNVSAADAPRASRVLLHAGNIFDFQNPPGLWKNVRREIDAGRPITIRFVGTVSPGIRRAIEELGLSPFAEYKGFLPFDKMIEEMCGADFLFVCATEKRHVPGKLFEYLRAGKPVIAFGDDNEEVAGLLRSCNAGVLLPYSYDGSDLFSLLDAVRPDPSAARLYSRARIAGQLAAILDSQFIQRRRRREPD
ncbi:MAG TPA: hypothetical protein VK470_08320, partial [Bacteroidota bacterium]|nr:hypothetical protein [Bacteroidota bacterium]